MLPLTPTNLRPNRALLTWMLVLSTAGLFAADWPTYMRDARRSGVSTDSLELPLAVNWTYTPPAVPGRAWPAPLQHGGFRELPKLTFDVATHAVLAGGTAYFGSPVDNGIHALDAASGTPRWSYYTEGPVRTAPTVAEGRVHVGSDDGFLYCLNAADGKLLWRVQPFASARRMLGSGRLASVFPLRSGLVVEDGVVYTGAGLFPGRGTALAAYEAATGKQIWKTTQTPRGTGIFLAPQGYILASADQLFVPCSRTAPLLYAKADGKVRGRPDSSYSTVKGKGMAGGDYGVLVNDKLWLGTQGILFAYNPDGKNAGNWPNSRQLLATDNFYYSLSFSSDKEPAAITAVNRTAYDAAAAKSKTVDTRKMTKWSWKNPAEVMIAAGVHLIAGGANQITVLEAATGKELGKVEVDGVVRGLATAGGIVLASTEDGKIHGLGKLGGGDPPAPKRIPATGRLVDTAKVVPLAAAIAKDSGLDRGFGLVLGAAHAPLALELARQTGLLMHVAEADPEKAQQARETLAAAGVYGARVLVETVPGGEKPALPYPHYFANLLVVDAAAVPPGISETELLRVLKPFGGLVYAKGLNLGGSAWNEAGKPAAFSLAGENGWNRLVRGGLPGAGSWTHQYADAGNTGSSEDELINGRPEILWYGEPGPEKMQDRHLRSQAPLSINGRVFVQGVSLGAKTPLIMCFDAYNGIEYWEREVPGAERVNMETDSGNLACSAAGLFVATGNRCLRLDLTTGQTLATYELPPSPAVDAKTHWAHVAVAGDTLLGSIGNSFLFSRSVFAYDIPSGKLKWHYPGAVIKNSTIAVADGLVYFAEHRGQDKPPKVLTPEEIGQLQRVQRAAAAAKDKEKKTDEEGNPTDADDEPETPPAAKAAPPVYVRTIVALQLDTGKPAWAVDVDLTGCGHSWQRQLGLSAKNGVVLLFGIFNAYKTPGRDAVRMGYALSAKDGSLMWKVNLGNAVRPLLIGDRIVCRPNSFYLQTGKPIMGVGKEAKKTWFIPSAGACGQMSASAHMLFYRSRNTILRGASPDGLPPTVFLGMRAGCLINILPAGGVITQVEASSGCKCYYALQSTITFVPIPQE